MATSADFWRGVIDGDGSIKFHPTYGTPVLEVVGGPALMGQLALFLQTVIADGRVVKTARHSQSDRVRMVKVSGRRAQVALKALYAATAADALPRKRARAMAAIAWQPRVRHSYPWARWGDGSEWVLKRGDDYDEAHRLWEAGRRAAREREMRLVFSDRGAEVCIRFVPRNPNAPPADRTGTTMRLSAP
jgi:hypothetical protein